MTTVCHDSSAGTHVRLQATFFVDEAVFLRQAGTYSMLPGGLLISGETCLPDPHFQIQLLANCCKVPSCSHGRRDLMWEEVIGGGSAAVNSGMQLSPSAKKVDCECSCTLSCCAASSLSWKPVKGPWLLATWCSVGIEPLIQ